MTSFTPQIKSSADAAREALAAAAKARPLARALSATFSEQIERLNLIASRLKTSDSQIAVFKETIPSSPKLKRDVTDLDLKDGEFDKEIKFSNGNSGTTSSSVTRFADLKPEDIRSDFVPSFTFTTEHPTTSASSSTSAPKPPIDRAATTDSLTGTNQTVSLEPEVFTEPTNPTVVDTSKPAAKGYSRMAKVAMAVAGVAALAGIGFYVYNRFFSPVSDQSASSGVSPYANDPLNGTTCEDSILSQVYEAAKNYMSPSSNTSPLVENVAQSAQDAASSVVNVITDTVLTPPAGTNPVSTVLQDTIESVSNQAKNTVAQVLDASSSAIGNAIQNIPSLNGSGSAIQDNAQCMIDVLAESAKPVAEAITEQLPQFSTWADTPVSNPFSKLVESATQVVADASSQVVNAVAEQLPQALGPNMSPLNGSAFSVQDNGQCFVEAAAQSAQQATSAVVEAMKEAIPQAAAHLKDTVASAMSPSEMQVQFWTPPGSANVPNPVSTVVQQSTDSAFSFIQQNFVGGTPTSTVEVPLAVIQNPTAATPLNAIYQTAADHLSSLGDAGVNTLVSVRDGVTSANNQFNALRDGIWNAGKGILQKTVQSLADAASNFAANMPESELASTLPELPSADLGVSSVPTPEIMMDSAEAQQRLITAGLAGGAALLLYRERKTAGKVAKFAFDTTVWTALAPFRATYWALRIPDRVFLWSLKTTGKVIYKITEDTYNDVKTVYRVAKRVVVVSKNLTVGSVYLTKDLIVGAKNLTVGSVYVAKEAVVAVATSRFAVGAKNLVVNSPSYVKNLVVASPSIAKSLVGGLISGVATIGNALIVKPISMMAEYATRPTKGEKRREIIRKAMDSKNGNGKKPMLAPSGSLAGPVGRFHGRGPRTQ